MTRREYWIVLIAVGLTALLIGLQAGLMPR